MSPASVRSRVVHNSRGTSMQRAVFVETAAVYFFRVSSLRLLLFGRIYISGKLKMTYISLHGKNSVDVQRPIPSIEPAMTKHGAQADDALTPVCRTRVTSPQSARGFSAQRRRVLDGHLANLGQRYMNTPGKDLKSVTMMGRASPRAA